MSWRNKDHENVAKLRGLLYESVRLLTDAKPFVIIEDSDVAGEIITDHIKECEALLDSTKE